ncbi:MAG TPA: epoxyqueuosine reductase [Clostridia bacterium]|nr:epoxyqueuosine reductase [Clostridia bacterium]
MSLMSKDIKKLIMDSGADLCGIASVESFSEAPEGYHPCDVLPSCKSVIVFAKKFLNGTLKCRSTTPYTIVRNILSDKMDKMAVAICTELESQGVAAVPTGTNGPTEYDKNTQRYRNIVSAKHCAVKAGLGAIGKNTLLVTPEFGNMVWLSVILVDIELEADSIIEGSPCPDGCSLCVDACPVKAVGNPELNQMDCWEYAFGRENGGDFKIKCFRCREVCPNCLGMTGRR